MLTILSVGEDNDLLRTRAEVLRTTGANVLCANGTSALKFIAEWEFDLIVVGHTVQRDDAARIADAAHANGSKTQTLLLVSDRTREQEYAGINLDAVTFVEPGCLIRSVVDLLSRQERQTDTLSGGAIKEKNLSRKRPESYPADIAARRALIAHHTHRRAG